MIDCPLHENTRGLINKETLKHVKKDAWIVNTARGAICVAEDVAEALKSGQILGYAGDVWWVSFLDLGVGLCMLMPKII